MTSDSWDLLTALRAAADTSPAALVGIDTTRAVRLWNAAAARLFGCSADAILGSPLPGVLEDRAEADALQTRALAGIASADVVLRRIAADGSSVAVRCAAAPIPDHSGRPAGAALSFLELSAATANDAERQRESLGVLAGGIAHDFNNLLTGILGYANLTRMELPQGTPVLPYLTQIEAVCLRAADLCKAMLAYAGRGPVFVETIDLGRLLRELAPAIEASVARRAAVTVEAVPSLAPVRGDAAQLKQVVLNLVLNAAEAVGETGGTIALTVSAARPDASDIPEGDYLALDVRDDGPGMTEEVKARVFDPFFSTKFTGRGMGLAAVQGIVRSHGGAVRVASAPGRGTTFRVLLPCVAAVAEAPARLAPPADDWRGGGTVLVADDEESVREVTVRLLRTLGFDVVQAADGQEAVERFAADPGAFRGVVLDLSMPRLDGEQTLRRMRQLRPDVPVLLMSGHPEPEVRSRFADALPDGFLQKPFPIAALRVRLREVLQAERPSTTSNSQSAEKPVQSGPSVGRRS